MKFLYLGSHGPEAANVQPVGLPSLSELFAFLRDEAVRALAEKMAAADRVVG